MTFTIANMS